MAMTSCGHCADVRPSFPPCSAVYSGVRCEGIHGHIGDHFGVLCGRKITWLRVRYARIGSKGR